MPILPLLDSSGAILSPGATTRLQAVMLFPGDSQQREMFLARQSIKLRHDLPGGLEISDETFDSLIQGVDGASFIESVRANFRAGGIAGYAFMAVARLAAHRPDDASLEKAFRLCQAEFVGNRNVFWKHWSCFANVSHLWAAWWLHKGAGGTWVSLFEALPYFLSVAEYFRLFGESFRSPRSSTTLLRPDDTWKSPPGLQLPKANVSHPELTYKGARIILWPSASKKPAKK